MLLSGVAGEPSTRTRTAMLARAVAADCCPPLLFTVVSVTIPHCMATSNRRSFWLAVLISVLSTSTQPVSPAELVGEAPLVACERPIRLSTATAALEAGRDSAEPGDANTATAPTADIMAAATILVYLCI